MITRDTFCDVLDGIKEYYTIYGRAPDKNSCSGYDLCECNLWEAEPAVLTLLSEGLNDYDNVISDWVHGLFIEDEYGVCHMEVHISGQSTQSFKIETSGDLYDYLMLINCGGDKEAKDIRSYRAELLAQYDLPYIPGGVFL